MHFHSYVTLAFLTGIAAAEGKPFEEDDLISDYGQCVLFQRALLANDKTTEVNIEIPEAKCRKLPLFAKPPFALNAWDKAALQFLQKRGPRVHVDSRRLTLQEICGATEKEADGIMNPQAAPDQCRQSRVFLRASALQQTAIRRWCDDVERELLLLFKYVRACERNTAPNEVELEFLKTESRKLLDRILSPAPLENPDPAVLEAIASSPEGNDPACVAPVWSSIVTRKMQHLDLHDDMLWPIKQAIDDCSEAKMREGDVQKLKPYFLHQRTE